MTTATHAAGYAGAADYNMIRTMFADTMEKNLYATTFLPRISSSKYLGKISKTGDTIKIARVPRVTTKAYARGQELDIDSSAQEGITLEVKRARYWTQFWDQLDLHQTHLELGKAETVMGATAQIAEDIEREFLAVAPTYAHAKNTGTAAGVKSGAYNLGSAASPVAISRLNAVAYITQIFSVMAEQNIADAHGKKSVLVPEWMRWLLVNSTQLSDASKIGMESSLKTNYVGAFAGVDVYSSSLLEPVAGASSNAFLVFACAKSAIDYVMALNKVEYCSPDKMFGSLTKGLVLYDWGNIRSEGIAAGYVYKSDTTILSSTGS